MGVIAELGKYLLVYFFSLFKFIAGPTLGIATGLSMVETAVLTILGMMTSVVLLTLAGAGEKLRSWIIKKFKFSDKKFTKGNRRFVKIWKKYGVFGVSFLTPLIFTPIGGTLLVTAVGSSRSKILIYMLISAVFWSFAISILIYQFRDLI